MLKVNFRGNIIEYKHIVPIKAGDSFIPNTERFKQIKATSPCNILDSDFKKQQEQGKTILINRNGGWCILISEMEIVK